MSSDNLSKRVQFTRGNGTIKFDLKLLEAYAGTKTVEGELPTPFFVEKDKIVKALDDPRKSENIMYEDIKEVNAGGKRKSSRNRKGRSSRRNQKNKRKSSRRRR